MNRTLIEGTFDRCKDLGYIKNWAWIPMVNRYSFQDDDGNFLYINDCDVLNFHTPNDLIDMVKDMFLFEGGRCVKE